VLFIDLDGFKDINDSLGYKAGDLVLVAAATAVTQPSRGRTCSGGTAGDEFLVVITNVGHGTARAIAQRAAEGGMDSLHSPFDLLGQRTFAEMVHAADHAMFTAKNAGRGEAALAPPPARTDPATPSSLNRSYLKHSAA